ncbi:translation initiation factor IF-2-like [Oenanthe melanoleuca]|uniref:translation initiation factor IF-2-like n=1 Tax=Oenanthe melanoleuca TaxID=2939378 RepID=UPI0024C202FE|nr:translation initiation factor IF-2-like [Oenanthe melanoleuca]
MLRHARPALRGAPRSPAGDAAPCPAPPGPAAALPRRGAALGRRRLRAAPRPSPAPPARPSAPRARRGCRWVPGAAAAQRGPDLPGTLGLVVRQPPAPAAGTGTGSTGSTGTGSTGTGTGTGSTGTGSTGTGTGTGSSASRPRPGHPPGPPAPSALSAPVCPEPAGVASETQNRWLFEAWGPAGRHTTGNRSWLKAERWKELPPGHKMTTTEPGARPQPLSISVPLTELCMPTVPGSLLRSCFTLPWRHPGVKAT